MVLNFTFVGKCIRVGIGKVMLHGSIIGAQVYILNNRNAADYTLMFKWYSIYTLLVGKDFFA